MLVGALSYGHYYTKNGKHYSEHLGKSVSSLCISHLGTFSFLRLVVLNISALCRAWDLFSVLIISHMEKYVKSNCLQKTNGVFIQCI